MCVRSHGIPGTGAAGFLERQKIPMEDMKHDGNQRQRVGTAFHLASCRRRAIAHIFRQIACEPARKRL